MPVEIRFEPIVRKNDKFPVNIADLLEREIGAVMTGPIRARLENSFEYRVSGWKHRPKFRSVFNRRAYKGNLTGFSLTTGPFGTNKRFWIFVSAGVKGRRIVPKRAQNLRIRGGVGGYSPLTGTGDRYGGLGIYDDTATFRSRGVNWPGIEARHFERYIADENRIFIFQILQAAVERATR